MGKRKITPSLRIVGGDRAATDDYSSGRNGVRRTSAGALEFRHEAKDGKDRWSPLSSPLRVVALTRDGESKNWGRLIELEDADGHTHRWAMPASLLAGPRGDEYRRNLLDLGAMLGHGARAADALHRHLSSVVDLNGAELPRAIAATRIGWHGEVFVLPDRAIGTMEPVVYQSESMIRPAIRQRGKLEEWQQQIAKPAEGNSRLVLALSTAFAASLLEPLGLDGHGIHFRGASSVGKTTALRLAGSVWGGRGDSSLTGYTQTWQATANGIEGMAAAHCDLPLCLDELSLVSGEDAGRVVYQLASGIGRVRATKSGQTAARLEWRASLISTGEVSLGDKMAEARYGSQRLMAGQAVRFIDIPADAGAGLGIFDFAPPIPNKPDGGTAADRGAALSEHLTSASQLYFGTAGPAFVEAFIANRDRALQDARAIIAQFRTEASGSDGQVHRVASTFGLIAAAGELATAFGILPWNPGEAMQAARACFAAWLEERGTSGPSEVEDAIAMLRAIVAERAASFQRIGSTDIPRDRLGFIRTVEENIEYLIFGEKWKQLMKGRDAKHIAKQLLARNILRPGENGRAARKERVGGREPQRMYVLNHEALFADE